MENPKSEPLELKKISRSFLAWIFPLHVGFTGSPLPLQNKRVERGRWSCDQQDALSQGRLQDEISEDLLKYDLHNTYEVVDNSNLLFQYSRHPQVIPQSQV